MGKRDKREKRRNDKMDAAFKKGLEAQILTCVMCKSRVKLLPLDGWVRCDCGHTLYRK